MALTDIAIKKAQVSAKLQKLSDSAGLQLHIPPTGAKLWRWAYRFQGKLNRPGFRGGPFVAS